MTHSVPILLPNEIIVIHDAVVSRFGGLRSPTTTQIDQLAKAEAVVGRIRSTLEYSDDFNRNDPFALATLHAVCIARAHAFADGNKRTALNAAGLVLLRSGVIFHDHPKLPQLMVDLAESDTDAVGTARRFAALVSTKLV